jgi:lipid-binding SYLF domain-containing protein
MGRGGSIMKKLAIAASLIATAAWGADTVQERLTEATSVFTDIMGTPDKGIPQDLLAKAECVMVVPNVKKAAFVVGGEYGKGFATCRDTARTGWTGPAAIEINGGSVGFQIGASSTDLILLVLNRKGMDKLMGDKVTLGADVSVAAGPVGRSASAETNVRLDAEMLSWSRSKGVFAGVSLKGASLRPDKSDNRALYGKDITNREILTGATPAPANLNSLAMAINKFASSTSADRVK